MSHRRIAAGLAAAVCLTAFATGCDGDDDGGTQDPTTAGTPARPPEPTEPIGAGPVEVAMVNISFDPVEIRLPVGAAAVWVNRDGVDHTATADETWDSGVVAPGETFEFTFDEPGTYSYVCIIHPTQMQGTVVVEG